VAAGVLPDTVTFRLAARYTGADRHLQAGEYRFAGPSTPLQVLDRLAAGDVYTHPLTFREGLTVFEMADVFERSGLGSSNDFLTAARNRTLVEARDPRARSLEGYLFRTRTRCRDRAARTIWFRQCCRASTRCSTTRCAPKRKVAA
jgi:UPF0755 protein